MTDESTLWRLEPHTNGKHLVLANYLDAWLAIMLRSNPLILYVDAFAGPGEYECGSKGSPLIALDRFVRHKNLRGARGRIAFRFIESQPDRHAHLESLIATRVAQLPETATCKLHLGTFDRTMTSTLDRLEREHDVLPPSLVMIDPFGVRGVPMSTVQRILRNPKSEVYFTFMYHTVNRFVKAGQYDVVLTNLFGTDEWRAGVDIADAKEKADFFVNLYKKGLKGAGAKQLLHFAIDKDNRPDYYMVIYATKSLKGSDAMKKAMWKVAPHGDYRFNGANLNQIRFGEGFLDYSLLHTQLSEQLQDRGWVAVSKLVDFVQSDATPFHSDHLVQRGLAAMEREKLIDARWGPDGAGYLKPGAAVRLTAKTKADEKLF